VAPHYATNPDHNRTNNYSAQGNVNPHTGEAGTKRDDGTTTAVTATAPSVNTTTTTPLIKAPEAPHVRYVDAYIDKNGRYVSGHWVTASPHKSASAVALPSSAPVPITKPTLSTTADVAVRDANGRIKRSESAKREFMRTTGYPNGRPGYVVDHITPLAKGGADDPSNMQWQTVEEAKAKDKWERK